MKKKWRVHDAGELENIADELLSAVASMKKFAVYGEMGAGKTTFIKAICRKLGVKETISSPTFAIVNEYHHPLIYHFDLYRIKTETELEQIGFEEYLSNDAWVFIEWPQIASGILSFYQFSEIRIILHTDGSRTIELNL